jgi:hypothetical protein
MRPRGPEAASFPIEFLETAGQRDTLASLHRQRRPDPQMHRMNQAP